MKRRQLWAAGAAAIVLAGCGKESSDSGARQGTAAAVAPVSIDRIAAEAKGFTVGSVMSTRVVYVFFDPQCPHCAALWDAARPLRPQARFVWIPVALLNDKSGPQGAAILNAGDPVAAMDQHEASMRSGQGGIAAMGTSDAQKEDVKRNTALMTAFGFSSVPTIVGKHAQTGDVVTVEGALPTQGLAQRLGLSIPG